MVSIDVLDLVGAPDPDIGAQIHRLMGPDFKPGQQSHLLRVQPDRKLDCETRKECR